MMFSDVELEGAEFVCPKCGTAVYKLEFLSDEDPLLLDKKREVVYMTSAGFYPEHNNMYEPKAFYRVHSCGEDEL
jgi:hypothetical protein